MAINIEQTINKAKQGNGKYIDYNVNKLLTDQGVYDPYFFLESELELNLNPQNYREHKAAGRMRHCKLDYTGYYDYIVNKSFKSLAEWAADCGSHVNFIRYGVNRTYRYGGLHVSIPLSQLLEYIGPVYDPEPEPQPVQQSQLVEEILQLKNLTLDNLWVMTDAKLIQWNDFTK